ncbi:hypothetical protein JW710_01180 [Candidatus Dojkabacteria bacterium]|nr:hypothetical protein [Candidatus Dojkabacteria bacterium]
MYHQRDGGGKGRRILIGGAQNLLALILAIVGTVAFFAIIIGIPLLLIFLF